MDEQLETMEQLKVTIIDVAVRFGPKLLAAILVLVVGILLSRWLGRWFDRGVARIELEPPIRLLLSRIARVLLLALFVIVALQNLGVELLPLIAGLSVAGAGIALAMQGVLGDLVAGLSIIFNKPFRIGDYISIAGEEGRVEAISLVQHRARQPGSLADRDPQSQDRRRDPAQLRPDAATGCRGWASPTTPISALRLPRSGSCWTRTRGSSRTLRPSSRRSGSRTRA